jgi:hypothetical protein
VRPPPVNAASVASRTSVSVLPYKPDNVRIGDREEDVAGAVQQHVYVCEWRRVLVQFHAHVAVLAQRNKAGSRRPKSPGSV